MPPLSLATFTPARILVCQLRQIGDVLLTTPSIELLKHRYPDAEIHVLTEKKCVPVLACNPHIARVWALDKQKLGSLPKELRWYWRLARIGFDLVVDFQQLPRCRWVVAFSGASVRLSYTPPWYTRLLYTHFVDRLDGYAALSTASILSPLGIHYTNEPPRLYLAEEERAQAWKLLAGLGLHTGDKLITVDPTHRRSTRRWPLAFYAETMRLLAARDKSLHFLPLWGPGEDAEIRDLISICGCADRLLLPSKMLSIREMAACIAAARLHIGNCSAPRHIAVAVDTPSCTIRGATSDAWTYPSPKHIDMSANTVCQPCNRNSCDKGLICLTSVSPRLVADRALGMLSA